MADLSGKVALITGAGSGIGQRTALLMASRGARVLVAASREESARGTLEQIAAAGGEAAIAFGDLGDAETPKKLVDAAIASFGRIDILVNNAAVTDAATLAQDLNIAEMDGAIWKRVLNINLVAPALLSKHAIPHMTAQGGGSIVMISSGRGVQGDFGLPAYGASKAAIINLALNIATQYGKQGIRANTVVVGMVATPATMASLDESMVELYTGHHLTPYIGRTEDIAAPIAFLASDESRFITGTVVTVDGGMTAHCAPYSDILKMSASSMLKQQ